MQDKNKGMEDNEEIKLSKKDVKQLAECFSIISEKSNLIAQMLANLCLSNNNNIKHELTINGNHNAKASSKQSQEKGTVVKKRGRKSKASNDEDPVPNPNLNDNDDDNENDTNENSTNENEFNDNNNSTEEKTKRKYNKRTKQKPDPNAPKKPNTAYMLYCLDKRSQVVEANPHLGANDIFRFLGESWRTLGPDEKKEYLSRYQREKVIYDQKMDEYKKSDSYLLRMLNKKNSVSNGNGAETNIKKKKKYSKKKDIGNGSTDADTAKLELNGGLNKKDAIVNYGITNNNNGSAQPSLENQVEIAQTPQENKQESNNIINQTNSVLSN
ncbi:hypothetical protein K502DRAFT_308014 [Neoconidiobolus thromboides FSU 785]|nr:hypothetical protein K502DRAFT_308014 [Neoconidiobolus thromboides FSU 785]